MEQSALQLRTWPRDLRQQPLPASRLALATTHADAHFPAHVSLMTTAAATDPQFRQGSSHKQALPLTTETCEPAVCMTPFHQYIYFQSYGAMGFGVRAKSRRQSLPKRMGSSAPTINMILVLLLWYYSIAPASKVRVGGLGFRVWGLGFRFKGGGM